MNRLDRFCRRRWPSLLVPLWVCTAGCTSVLSTAALRDLVWEGGPPHAAEVAAPAPDSGAPELPPAETDADPAALDGFDAARRQAAIDEAVERLASLGSIGDAARGTLVETLERTEPEDWPAVIEAFAESLPPAEARLAAKADLDATAGLGPSTAPLGEPAPAPEPPAVVAVAAEPASAGEEVAPVVAVAAGDVAAEPPPAPEPAAKQTLDHAAPLSIQNACFATRVQGWGLVDRFASDRFRPGQEVIVYFELVGLSAGESAAGHTTCIDSTLRLVTADGTRLHSWSFEPIAETCRARRQDYFARYVVRLPETAPAGACRVEFGVSDTLSGKVASATLPLEILPPPADAGAMARGDASRVD